jgi:glycosyltransferase involved in cell wall biosynthesis
MAAGRTGAAEGPLVSVIIIFLNEERYLSEAIESVFEQSYANWELLLVDDGSTDASSAIAMACRDRCPAQVRYLTHEGGANRGMSASRNLGLLHARGEFVGFLDGDDAWVPDKLERQVDLFRDNPEALVICGASLRWHSWDQASPETDRLILAGATRRSFGGGCTVEQNRLHPGLSLMKQFYPLGQGKTPSMSGMLVRRQALEAVGGFEESFRGLFEDQVIRAKLFLLGPAYVSDHCFDKYRQHQESCCSVARATGNTTQVRRRYLQWVASYLSAAGIDDPDIRRKLRRRLAGDRFPKLYRIFSRFVHGRVRG